MRSFHTSIRRSLRALALAAPAGLALLAAACNDNPTTIGSDYLPESVVFQKVVLQPEQLLSDVASLSNSSSSGAVTFMVGRALDGTAAHSLLVISGTSDLVQRNVELRSAELLLTPRSYRFPSDGTADARFDVVVLDGVFNENAKWDPALVSQIQNAPSLGTFTVSTADTTKPVALALDPVAADKFLHEYFRYDTVNSSRQTRLVKTLALRAPAEGGRNIVSFLGSTFRDVPDSLKPALRVRYDDTTVVLRSGVSNWIASLPEEPGLSRFVLGGGAPIRSYLRFNLDSLPAAATIHQTELNLHVDPARSISGSYGSPTFLVAYAADQNTLAAGSRLSTGYTGLFSGNRLAQDSTSFTNVFRITSLSSLVTNWLRYKRGLGGIPNDGLILALNRSTLRADLETGSVDRLTFYGNEAADPALRPTLTIIYSVQTDAKK